MRLRKPTVAHRRTVDQQLVEVLGCEEGKDLDGTYREVIIFVAADPEVFFSIDHATPEEAGLNRIYDFPILMPGGYPAIRLQPNQRLYAAAREKFATLSLVVHYVEESD